MGFPPSKLVDPFLYLRLFSPVLSLSHDPLLFFFLVLDKIPNLWYLFVTSQWKLTASLLWCCPPLLLQPEVRVWKTPSPGSLLIDPVNDDPVPLVTESYSELLGKQWFASTLVLSWVALHVVAGMAFSKSDQATLLLTSFKLAITDKRKAEIHATAYKFPRDWTSPPPAFSRVALTPRTSATSLHFPRTPYMDT